MTIRRENSEIDGVPKAFKPSVGVITPPEKAQKAAWLVSIRDLTELRQALQFDVNIIDLKEPSDHLTNGPLAPVDPSLWRQSVDHMGNMQQKVPLSAALGEWRHGVTVANEVPSEFAFAKIGPSECRRVSDLIRMWTETRAQLHASVELVAVSYADAEAANCPDVMDVMKAAAQFGLKRFLVDTFGKDGRSSVDVLGYDKLAAITDTARSLGLWWTLAGSITSQHVCELRTRGIHPDCYGVRGDVCGAQRTDCLSVDRMKIWMQALADA